jgi:hypothetical protein
MGQRRQERADDPSVEVQLDDDEDVVPRNARSVDRRSFDFVWRSGVAGGLAGCAVSSLTTLFKWLENGSNS